MTSLSSRITDVVNRALDAWGDKNPQSPVDMSNFLKEKIGDALSASAIQESVEKALRCAGMWNAKASITHIYTKEHGSSEVVYTVKVEGQVGLLRRKAQGEIFVSAGALSMDEPRLRDEAPGNSSIEIQFMPHARWGYGVTITGSFHKPFIREHQPAEIETRN